MKTLQQGYSIRFHEGSKFFMTSSQGPGVFEISEQLRGKQDIKNILCY